MDCLTFRRLTFLRGYACFFILLGALFWALPAYSVSREAHSNQIRTAKPLSVAWCGGYYYGLRPYYYPNYQYYRGYPYRPWHKAYRYQKPR